MIFTVISSALAIKRCLDLSTNQERNLFMKILLIFFNIWSVYHYPIIYLLITSFIMLYVQNDESKQVILLTDSGRIYNQAKDLARKLNTAIIKIKKNQDIIKFSENVSDKYNAMNQNENLIERLKLLSSK